MAFTKQTKINDGKSKMSEDMMASKSVPSTDDMEEQPDGYLQESKDNEKSPLEQAKSYLSLSTDLQDHLIEKFHLERLLAILPMWI